MTDVETVPWPVFMASRFQWAQGEHVSLIGNTGGGKTTLALAITPKRRYCVVFGTKPKDSTLSGLLRNGEGWQRVQEWKPKDDQTRLLLWPKAGDAATMVDKQRAVFRPALHRIFRAGAWCVVADEVRYLAKNLGLQRELELYWLQGRSLGISLVTATQRPAHVPLEMYSQATHVFLWRDTDQRNIRRLGEIGGINQAAVAELVPQLPRFHVLYVNGRTGDMLVTKVQR